MARNSAFVLQPFEHEGLAFDPAPHAEAHLEVAGAKRHFLLKKRDGILFFKEATRPTVYAAPAVLSAQNDPDALICGLKSALEGGDVGRFVSRHLWFPKVGGATVVCIIHRADRSGLVKEWCGDEWLPFGALGPEKRLDLWAPRLFLHYANRRAANHLLASILQSTFEPPQRRNLPKKWLRGDPAALERVVSAILQLCEPHAGRRWSNRKLRLAPHNAFSAGSLREGVSDFWQGAYDFAPLTRRWMDLVEQHFAFCELKWLNHRVKPWEYGSQYYDEKLIDAGNEKFGPNWRGNWYLGDTRHTIEVPAYSAPSAHEKLEAVLLLQEWLRGKIPASRAARLARRTLDEAA